MRSEDQQLMLQVADGDLEAFGDLVDRHRQTAWRVAYRMLGDAAEAEDAAQQAFLKIFEAAPRYRPTAAFRTYLYQVITRHCLDRLEKKKPIYTDSPPVIEDHTPGPAKDLEIKERRQVIHRALEELPERQRTAVVLFHFEELSYKEIADSMEISPKAVERLLGRGRLALACILSGAPTLKEI